MEDFNPIHVEQVVSDKVRDFGDLLKEISSTDDKKKRLWLEIYENAVTDRAQAFNMFIKLAQIVQDKSTEHAVHGRTMQGYIERMSKANDQLIKLAELVSQAVEETENMSADLVYGKIAAGGR